MVYVTGGVWRHIFRKDDSFPYGMSFTYFICLICLKRSKWTVFFVLWNIHVDSLVHIFAFNLTELFFLFV